MDTRRNDITGFKHFVYEPTDALKFQVDVDNFLYKTDKEEDKWIQDATELLAEWRLIFKSTYSRWAIAINGLFVASEKYKNPEWYEKNKFQIGTLRIENGEHKFKQDFIEWDGISASQRHLETTNYISEYGIIDLYACFEEFIFSIYKCHLNYFPEKLIKGPENKEIRRLFNKREESAEDKIGWEKAWEERLQKWQQKKIYEGLGKVFLDYCNYVGLSKPHTFKTGPEDWAANIEFIGGIRNCITHGLTKIPKSLIDIKEKSESIVSNIKEGDAIKINISHLQQTELFSFTLINAINLSLLELAIKNDD